MVHSGALFIHLTKFIIGSVSLAATTGFRISGCCEFPAAAATKINRVAC